MHNHKDVVIYKSVNVPVKRKMKHQKYSALYKRNKRSGIGFCWDEGDIPVTVLVSDKPFGTVRAVEVVNTRGRAYACRNQNRYFKNKRKYIPDIVI